ncbi:uncharacterized protein LOC108669043 [Hyalella azteca]|uniref:Uncharacterized protein LOC108669043 n=1 Tax=Hyalella azteca TaxID=294128 RepID=A0A8B7NDY1_HYAAZ|nr:uncharacterized protein LOC108669043 [Hyalella azteca]
MAIFIFVNVVSGSSGALGCGGGRTTSVRFRTLQVRGPKSMVTYIRFSITESDLAFATNASKKITASDVVQCARSSALADMTAFAFDGTCMAYQFNSKPCSCHGGEKVIYVANSSISYAPPATVPFSTALYINTTVENIEFKQYQLANFFSDVFSDFVYSLEGSVVDSYQYSYFIPRENGRYNVASYYILDVASCVTDTPCGLPVFVNTIWPTYYILNECGKTIRLPPLNPGGRFMVFSHPGFGCLAFPDGPTYNCSVTFTTAATLVLNYYGYFSGADGSCGGYTLGLETSSPERSGQVNWCTDRWVGESDSVTFLLRGTAAAKTFKAGFSVSMR